jgi:hypothetical protein
MTLQNFQELDIAGDFKLDDVLSENQEDEVKSNFGQKTNDTKKIYNSVNNYEAKKILKKMGTRLTSEELEQKQHLIIQISRFRDSSRFSNFLNSLGFQLSPSHLKSLDISDLEDLLIELKSSIQNKNGSKIVDEGYFMAIGMLENITKHPKFNKYLDLEGLSKASRENDELLDCLECISLLYADFGNLSPEKKIVFLTMSNIMRVSALNKMLKNIKNYEEKLKNDSEQSSPKETETELQQNDSPLRSAEGKNQQVSFNTNSQNKNMDNVLNFDIVKN